MRVQSALAISILTTAPMRMRNVASLRLGRHVVQTRPGGVRHIVIPAEEVKNRTPLAFEVSDALGEVMDVYLARCRPLLAGDPEDLLFPAREGGARTPGKLAAQIKRTLRQETGREIAGARNYPAWFPPDSRAPALGPCQEQAPRLQEEFRSLDLREVAAVQDDDEAAPSAHERAGRGGFAPATRRGLLVVSWCTFLEKGVHPFHPVRVRHTIH